VIVALADDGPDGDLAQARLHGERLTVPELADPEVTSVLRRQMKAGVFGLASRLTIWPPCPPGGHRTAPCSPGAVSYGTTSPSTTPPT
jgi:hypothetical protein